MTLLGVVLTEGQIAVYGILGTVITAIVTAVFGPGIVAWINSKKDIKSKDQEKAEKQREEAATVKIAEINDDAATRTELWKEVRFLRQDYNQLSMAYAQLQKQYAESLGDSRYMKLQIENITREIDAVKQLREKDHEEYNRKLAILEADRDKWREKAAELELEKGHLLVEMDRVKLERDQLRGGNS